MNHKDKEKLLSDVCAEAAPASFREELLGKVLQQARRKKTMRHLRGVGLVVTCVALLSIWMFRKPSVPPTIVSKPSENNWIVHTTALAPEMMVRTEPLQPPNVILSEKDALVVIHSAPARELFTFINDDQLFGLLDGAPAALVRHGDEVNLVFANPSDERKFIARTTRPRR